jgi:isoprenylcysteine carboxyl methyltransferase (ICMT) family protein YpbQ
LKAVDNKEGQHVLSHLKESTIIIVITAWYLFGLLTFAALAQSAITYAPSERGTANVILGIIALLAVFVGLGAVWLTVKRKQTPESGIFHSKRASNITLCIAGILTLFVLLVVVG